MGAGAGLTLLLGFGTVFPTVPGGRSAGTPQTLRMMRLDRNAKVFPDRIVVKRASSGLAKSSRSWDQALAKVSAQRVTHTFPAHADDNSRLSRIYDVRLPAGSNVFDACEILMSDPSVEWAEPLYPKQVCYTPNDPLQYNQWYLAKVKARDAWDVTRQSSGVIIGIVDTGVWTDHPDLKGSIWINADEIPGDDVDNDQNDFIDDVNGWDFGGNDNDPRPPQASTNDVRWHGTMVAGIAGAVSDNNVGIASVAFNAKIMPVKVFEDAEQGTSIIAESYKGIAYAADNGAHIINCSFGGSYYQEVEKETIAHACSLGCLVVGAAGNSGYLNDGSPGQDVPSYPGSYPGALSVANTTSSDLKEYASNYHYTVDVSAPGTLMYTTYGESGYTSGSGTSFSAPTTSAIAAMVKGMHPDWSGLQAGEQVRVSSDPIDLLNSDYAGKLGWGRVNALRAVTIKSPSVRLEEIVLSEGSGGNGDGLFDPGEEVAVHFALKNYLEPASSVSVVFSCSKPGVTLENNVQYVSSLGTLGKWTNTGKPMRIRLNRALTRGQTVWVTAVIQADGGYSDKANFSFFVSPSYATVNGGRAGLTIAAMGRLGFADINTDQGDGFLYRGANLLCEGAILAGTSVDMLSDVARGDDGSTQNSDFAAVPGGEVEILKPGPLSSEQGTAAFSDDVHDPSLHLGVQLTALAFDDSADADYVLLAYRLFNTSSTPIQKLYFGLFMDWDIQEDRDASTNLAGYDAALSMAYIFERLSRIYGGLAVLSKGGATIHKCINNEDELYDGYTKQEKWFHLSGGIRNVSISQEADYSHVLGVGPLDIPAGDTVLVGFAAVGGFGLDMLKASTTAAKAKWTSLFETSSAVADPAVRPSVFRLVGAYPNPFNAATVIRYDVPEKSRVAVTIHDLLGREIARPVEAVEEPGRHEARWNGIHADGRHAPSGIYFCRIQAGGRTLVVKLSLIR